MLCAGMTMQALCWDDTVVAPLSCSHLLVCLSNFPALSCMHAGRLSVLGMLQPAAAATTTGRSS
mgnify:CR=1 FL=1